MNIMKRLIMLTFFGLTIASCGQTEEVTQTSVEEIKASNETKRLERVDEVTFLSFIQDNKDVQIIDVRTPGEYSDGFIPNAVNIDFNGDDFKGEINKLDKNKPVLIYCHSGGRSGKALNMMKDMNFTTVLELEGGYSNYITPGN
jgi:rhodanese-related sulfurtransferase